MYSSHRINLQLYYLMQCLWTFSFQWFQLSNQDILKFLSFYIIFHSKPNVVIINNLNPTTKSYQKVVQHTKTHTCDGDNRFGIHRLGFLWIGVLCFSLILVGSSLLFTAWEFSGYGFFFFFFFNNLAECCCYWAIFLSPTECWFKWKNRSPKR